MAGRTVLLIIFVLGCFYLSRISSSAKRRSLARRIQRQHGCLDPPEIPCFRPFLGLDIAYQMLQSYSQGRRSVTFWQQHESYGKTFQTSVLGTKRVFTSDADNIRAMLSTKFQSWGAQAIRLKYWEPLVGAGVMNTDPPRWNSARKLIQPIFKRIDDIPWFESQVEAMMTQIPGDGSAIDLQPLFARLILDFTMEFLFGSSCDSSDQDSSTMRFLAAFQEGKKEMGKRTQLSFMSWLYSESRFREVCRPVHDMVDEYIDQAKARAEKEDGAASRRHVLVNELLKVTDDRDYIRAHLLNVFLAAHDTTAILMTNVIFNLARNAHIYADLRREVCSHGDLHLSLDELRKITYLWNTVLETSRLTPVVGQSARIALEDTILPTGGGPDCKSPVFTPKGTAVQLDYLAMNRNQSIFGHDVDVFRPARWNDIQVRTWDYLPFSGGPRVCPGQNMALMQVCYVTGKIAQRFERIQNVDPVLEFVELYRIISFSKNGCKVALHSSDTRSM